MKRTALTRKTPLRSTSLARTGGLQRHSGLRAQSTKRGGFIRAYVKLRREVLARDGHACRRCGATGLDFLGRPLETQHLRGRVGADALDADLLLTLCPTCHQWATEHPLQAVADGWALRRVS